MLGMFAQFGSPRKQCLLCHWWYKKQWSNLTSFCIGLCTPWSLLLEAEHIIFPVINVIIQKSSRIANHTTPHLANKALTSRPWRWYNATPCILPSFLCIQINIHAVLFIRLLQVTTFLLHLCGCSSLPLGHVQRFLIISHSHWNIAHYLSPLATNTQR